MPVRNRHMGPYTTPLSAALTALEILQPVDEKTGLAILETLGYRPARGTEAIPVIDTDPTIEFGTDNSDEEGHQRRGLRVVSSTDQPPPVVPSELALQDDTGSVPPQWLDETPTIPLPSMVSDPFSEPLAPLLASNYSRAIISRIAAQPLPMGEIDLDRIIDRTGKCLPFQSVPRCLLPSLAQGVQLLIDTHEGMQPLRMDIRDLIGEMLRTVGWDRVEIYRFKGCPSWGIQRNPMEAEDRYQPPGAGRPVLIVTDMGIGAVKEAGARPSMTAWNDFIGRLKRARTRATVLIPYAPKHWPIKLPEDMDLVVWDRTTTATSLGRQHRPIPRAAADHTHIAFIHPRLASASPDAVRLGILASMATRIEPQLLRRLRLELAADLDAGAEVALWQSDLVQDRAPTGIVMNAEIRTILQRRLAQMPLLFDAAYHIILQLHRRSAPALRLEEELVYHALKGNTAKVRELLRSMVATLISPNRQGVAGWAGQALLRIPREIKDLEEVKLLAAGTAFRLGDTSALERLENGSGAGLHWLMPRRREIEIALNLRLGAVEFGPIAMRAAHRILVPDAPTVIIELRWSDETGEQRLHYLRIQPGQRKIYEIDGDVLDLNIIGGQRYRLATTEEEQFKSSQKFISRNRAPRVQIEYDLEIYGEMKTVELPFVIGVMAGLSGTAAASLPPIAERRFFNIEVDNFDACMERIQPGIAFGVQNHIDGYGEIPIDLAFMRLEHFRPDAVVDHIPPLKLLKRQRELFKELLTEIESDGRVAQVVVELTHSSAMSKKEELSKRSLIESRETSDPTFEAAFEVLQKRKTWSDQRGELIRQALQHLANAYRQFHLEASEDAEEAVNALLREFDNRLGAQLLEILHHPDFLALEASWRGLYYLVANTETDELLKIKCLNITKKELHRSLARYKGARWEESPIFKLIIENVYGQFDGEPYGCLVGDFYFDHRQPDVGLLGQIANIAAAAHSPFITGAAPAVMRMESWDELSGPADLGKRFRDAEYAPWRALRESESSRYIGLTMPRFLARLPYGLSTDPIEAFDFEEASNGTDKDKYIWANAAYAMAANISRAFKLYGWCARIRGVESGGAVEGLPVHPFPTDDGGVDMKSPTEIGISDRRESELAKLGFMPLVHRKNSDLAAFIGAQSLHHPAEYEDPDATANANLAARLPYQFACCRFAHYVKCLVRDKIGSFKERKDMQRWLQSWMMIYVDGDPAHSSETTKARKPLAAAEIVVEDAEDGQGYYIGKLYVRPHYQLEGLTVSLRTIFKLPSPEP